MKRVLSLIIVCIGCATMVSWGQSKGIMPKRSMSIRLPKQNVSKEHKENQALLDETERVEVLPLDTAARLIPFSQTAVDMLGYDKRLTDTKESFLLRNNTSYHLSRVVVKLVYRSPDGTMINYRTCTVECDLLPHSTRRCELPSFDTSKSYYHVDSPPSRASGRPFKVTFQLLRYDVVVEP